MLEAVNENRADCFGWALEEALEGSRGNLLQLRREASAECKHHHVEKTALLSSRDERSRRHDRKWTWCPPWKELRTHYFRDIGFLACFSQMTGATVFWISGLTGLPQILDVLAMPVENGIYWLPQVIMPCLSVHGSHTVANTHGFVYVTTRSSAAQASSSPAGSSCSRPNPSGISQPLNN